MGDIEDVNQDSGWDIPGSPEPHHKDITSGGLETTPTTTTTSGNNGSGWKANSNVNNGTDLWEANLRSGGAPPPQPTPQKVPWGHTPTTNHGGTLGEEERHIVPNIPNYNDGTLLLGMPQQPQQPQQQFLNEKFKNPFESTLIQSATGFDEVAKQGEAAEFTKGFKKFEGFGNLVFGDGPSQQDFNNNNNEEIDELVLLASAMHLSDAKDTLGGGAGQQQQQQQQHWGGGPPITSQPKYIININYNINVVPQPSSSSIGGLVNPQPSGQPSISGNGSNNGSSRPGSSSSSSSGGGLVNPQQQQQQQSANNTGQIPLVNMFPGVYDQWGRLNPNINTRRGNYKD